MKIKTKTTREMRKTKTYLKKKWRKKMKEVRQKDKECQ